MLVLRAGGHGFVDEFRHSSTVHEVEYPPLTDLIISAAGTVAGVLMISAGRFTQLAGPLVALQLFPLQRASASPSSWATAASLPAASGA
jgi:hypothetical protein